MKALKDFCCRWRAHHSSLTTLKCFLNAMKKEVKMIPIKIKCIFSGGEHNITQNQLIRSLFIFKKSINYMNRRPQIF